MPPASAEPAKRARPYPTGGGAFGLLQTYLVLLLALAWEGGLAWLLGEAELPAWPLAAAHGVLLALLGIWVLVLWRLRQSLHLPLLLLLTVAVCGPFGAGGCLMTLLLYHWFAQDTTTFDQWYGSLFPEEEHSQARDLYDLITSGREVSSEHHSVTSFSDVLALGSSDQKRAVISLLLRNWRPAFAPALRQALADTDPAIRVQAATAVAEIEKDFTERAMKLQQSAKEAPDEPAVHMGLGRHHDDYAFSGLLDPSREAEARRQAIAAYTRAVELNPELAEGWVALGRLLLRLGRSEEAANLLGQAVERGQTEPQLLDWHLEALFARRDYDGLRRYAPARVRSLEGAASAAEPRIAAAIRLWAGVDRPAPLEANP